LGSDGDQPPQSIQLFRPDAFDKQEILDGGEKPVGSAILYDPFGQRSADARQLVEFMESRVIHINDWLRRRNEPLRLR
jgi:hypothetical protein